MILFIIAILVRSQACADFKKARGPLESVLVACGWRQVVPLPVSASSSPETTLLLQQSQMTNARAMLLTNCFGTERLHRHSNNTSNIRNIVGNVASPVQRYRKTCIANLTT